MTNELKISIYQACKLLEFNRSSYYYIKKTICEENIIEELKELKGQNYKIEDIFELFEERILTIFEKQKIRNIFKMIKI